MRLRAHNLIGTSLLLLLSLLFPYSTFAETTSYRNATTVTTDGAASYSNLSNCSLTDGITCDHPVANGYANLYFRNFGDETWRPYTGNQITASGSNYHNDIAIRVQATQASPGIITQYYVSFYAKGRADPITCNADTEELDACLYKFRARILNAPQNGFLLKFGRTTPTDNPPNNYWVWKDYTGWEPIESGVQIPPSGTRLYKITADYLNANFLDYKWFVTFDKSMGSNSFYTGVIAVNSSGKYSVRGEVPATDLP